MSTIFHPGPPCAQCQGPHPTASCRVECTVCGMRGHVGVNCRRRHEVGEGNITARSRDWNSAGAQRAKKEEEARQRMKEREERERMKREAAERKRVRLEGEKVEKETRERERIERDRSMVKVDLSREEFGGRFKPEFKSEYGREEDIKGTSGPRIETRSRGYRAAPEPPRQPSCYQSQHQYGYGAAPAYEMGQPNTRASPVVPAPIRQPSYSYTHHQPRYQSSTAFLARGVRDYSPSAQPSSYCETRPQPSSQYSAHSATSFPRAPSAPAAMRRGGASLSSRFPSGRAPRPSPQEMVRSAAYGPQIDPGAYIPYRGSQNSRGGHQGFDNRGMQHPAARVPSGPAAARQTFPQPPATKSLKRTSSPSNSRNPSISASDRSVKIKREPSPS